MKTADLAGFELDFDETPQRKADFAVTVPLSREFLPKPSIDYAISEMTLEQREVFDALEFEGDDDAYEQLEDDFVILANDGEVPLMPKNLAANTAVAEDIQKALIKEKKKKFHGVIFGMETGTKKDSKTKKDHNKLLDKVDKWDADDMEKFGYKIEAPGLVVPHVDDFEFPALDGDNFYESIEAEEAANHQKMLDSKNQTVMPAKPNAHVKFQPTLEPILEENILGRMEMSVHDELEICESKNVNLEADADIDLVQVIASEENVAALLDAEYNDNKKETQPLLSHSAFNRVMDSHLKEMETRQKINPDKFEQKETFCAGNKPGKKNQRKVSEASDDGPENQLDNMLKGMGEAMDSDDEFGAVDLNAAPIQERKGKAGVLFVDDNIEEVKKFRGGNEYKSESFTSSLGGKLIINSIKKRTQKKGKPMNASKKEKLPDDITEVSERSKTTKTSSRSKKTGLKGLPGTEGGEKSEGQEGEEMSDEEEWSE
jgi:hypothetical protein